MRIEKMSEGTKQTAILCVVAVLAATLALVFHLAIEAWRKDAKTPAPVEKVSPATTRPANVGPEKPSVAKKGREEGKGYTEVRTRLSVSIE
jgi:hypothetical protein